MEEEKILNTFEVLYNNEKGDVYVTNKFLVFISEKKKKESENECLLLTDQNIDLKLCVFSWKKTEKSKKKKKIRFTFAKACIQENLCIHDYRNTNAFIFDFFDDAGYNNLGEIISCLNKENVENHVYVPFNLSLLKEKYNILCTENKKENRENNGEIGLEHNTLTKTDGTLNEIVVVTDTQVEGSEGGFFTKLDELRKVNKTDKQVTLENEKREEFKLSEENIEEEDEEDDEEEDDVKSEENETNMEFLLNTALNTDSAFLNLYDITIRNNIMSKSEFIKLHKNYIEKYRNDDLEENHFILKEPVYISEEKKKSKNIDISKEKKITILRENKQLRKVYEYYMENSIISENQFWYFLYNNKYSHLFFTDKNDKKMLTNDNHVSIKIDLDEPLSFSLENSNQDIKGTLEKCILKEYISTKCYDKKNPLIRNNYFLPEETPEGYGLMTNEKLVKNNVSSNYLLINKFNNYSINSIKDRSLNFETYCEELKEKAEDPTLMDQIDSQECKILLERTKISTNTENEEGQIENEKDLKENFENFIDELEKGKNPTKKNYSDVFNIGRHLLVVNTKKCQNNQSLLIGTIEYESSLLDIVKQYHHKVNYLMRLFYTSYIPEQEKRSKILKCLFQIRDEIQEKQEEYNSVLIMGKPLLIYLFEQISICKKFNEKLDRFIEERRRR